MKKLKISSLSMTPIFFFYSEEYNTKFDSDVYKYPSAYNISVSHIPFKARKKIYGKGFKNLNYLDL